MADARTTVVIDADLLKDLKHYAIDRGWTLREVFEQALQEYMVEQGYAKYSDYASKN